MAIEIKYNSEFEYEFKNAYAKIENIQIDIQKEEVWINVRTYATQAARNAITKEKFVNGIAKETVKLKLSELKSTEFSVDSIKKECYNQLKKQKKYKEGKDV